METLSHFSSGNKFAGDGFTFDDVLLLPAYSQILPRETELAHARLRETLRINIPILICRNGHGYRSELSHCFGARRWHWCVAQKHVD
jgi:hypothetical protein